MNIKSNKKQLIHRKHSFSYAFDGCKVIWLTEMNFRIHLFVSLLVLCLGFVFRLNNLEWVGISLCIGMVISAEIFNTAIELLCDLKSKEFMAEIKVIKDISAFGVLFLAIISIIIGIIIFLPKVIYLFSSI